MADPGADARIRDLKRRLELDPSSRLFVSLAEEYRKTGRIVEALSTLQKGLLAHPSYLSAQVALGRAYLEAGQITEAIATFSKTLATDPGNLVAARSLADIYLSRGESVEAIKKYKLYRALSGDRTVEEVIERLQHDLAPPPPSGAGGSPDVPPPPTFFEQRRTTGTTRLSRDSAFAAPVIGSPRSSETLDETSVKFELDDSGSVRPPFDAEPPSVLSRDVPLVATSSRRESVPSTPPAPVLADDLSTRAFRVSKILSVPPPPEPETVSTLVAREPATRPETVPPGREAARSEPSGRTLADLYYAQGHYTEALRIYDDLVAANPFDEELKRLRRDAEARLLPAGSTPGAAAPDTALERRLAKIRALKRWLGVVQTG